MNTASYTACETKDLVCKLEGGTASKLQFRMWVFMFTQGKTAKFPERNNGLQTLHTGDKKGQLRQTVE
jgi:hypothetical protein